MARTQVLWEEGVSAIVFFNADFKNGLKKNFPPSAPNSFRTNVVKMTNCSMKSYTVTDALKQKG